MEVGYCHICQKYGKLTFEHIPPHKAFNYFSAKSIENEEIIKLMCSKDRKPWETNGLKYKPKQRGVGIYSLCQSCNNLTGKYYGNEYIKFANIVHKLFPKIKEIIQDGHTKNIGIHIEKINILLFAKQVLSMFCSTCPHITQNDPYIIDLLLNKEQTGLDTKKYKLSMFLLKNYKISYSGLQSVIEFGKGFKTIATIDAYPFGFVLEFDPNNSINSVELDITSFFNDYECKNYAIELVIPVLEHNNVFPCDYRSKQEIIRETNKNKIDNKKLNIK